MYDFVIKDSRRRELETAFLTQAWYQNWFRLGTIFNKLVHLPKYWMLNLAVDACPILLNVSKRACGKYSRHENEMRGFYQTKRRRFYSPEEQPIIMLFTAPYHEPRVSSKTIRRLLLSKNQISWLWCDSRLHIDSTDEDVKNSCFVLRQTAAKEKGHISAFEKLDLQKKAEHC